MPTDVRILTARQAWEFRPDDLRLTALTLQPLQARISELIGFQTHGIGMPMPSFGPVSQSIPPGLVFDNGAIRFNDQLVPIRFLHFEQFRVVVDVAGPTEAAAAVLNQIKDLLAAERSADGAPVLGEPWRTLELSQLSVRMSFTIDALFGAGFLAAAAGIVTGPEHRLTFAPSLSWVTVPRREDFPGFVEGGDHTAFQLAPRAGYPISDRRFFSAAPLTTSSHIKYLSNLDKALAPRKPRAQAARQKK
jgi:hypothetical protein